MWAAVVIASAFGVFALPWTCMAESPTMCVVKKCICHHASPHVGQHLSMHAFSTASPSYAMPCHHNNININININIDSFRTVLHE
jgi:hypothetical protein